MPTAAGMFSSQYPATIARSLLAMAAGCLFAWLSLPALADESIVDVSAGGAPRHAEFLGRAAPDSVHHMADWVVDAKNNAGLPFAIIDKPDAKAFVFDKDGKLVGSAWVLVGLAPGDDSVPGIGTMPLTDITPDIRTTPAGRFVASMGHDLKSDVLWVDYADAISLHRVINTNPAERRLERIVSDNPAEHRISYGCINVPAKFFDGVVKPAFKDGRGVVYILPEVKAMRDVFPNYYDVDAPRQAPNATGGALIQAAYPAAAPEEREPSALVARPGKVAAQQ